MKLEDALFNWLQIKIVADARPDDRAAADTLEFFATILREDHGLTDVRISRLDDSRAYVQYVQEGKTVTQTFDREEAEKLLHAINANPKFNEPGKC